jgi:hypothetical protein
VSGAASLPRLCDDRLPLEMEKARVFARALFVSLLISGSVHRRDDEFRTVLHASPRPQRRAGTRKHEAVD